MEKSYRRARCIALVGLALMLFTGAYYQREESISPRELLSTFGDARIYIGATDFSDALQLRFSREELFKGNLLYVSASSPLPEHMPVQQAHNVRKMVGLYVPAAQDVSLSEETIYALCDLCAENPLVRTWIISGVRAPSEQYALQDATFENYRKLMSTAEALSAARRDVPDSGKSEHQLATSFDVTFTGELDWSYADALDRSKDGRWLRENAWRFGFIRRYPPGKAQVTGVANETLHFRYVSYAHALVMQSTLWCLEEYLQALKTYGALTIEQGEAITYILCRAMDENGAVFPVPEGFTCQVSADNLGYAVCVLQRAQSAIAER